MEIEKRITNAQQRPCVISETTQNMKNELKIFFSQFSLFSEKGIENICLHFSEQVLKKKEFLLKEGQHCRHLSFIVSGTFRFFHINEKGNERDEHFSLGNEFVVDIQSFMDDIPAKMNIQAISNSRILTITQSDYNQLLKTIPKLIVFENLMLKKSLFNTYNRLVSLLKDSPDTRYLNLLQEQPRIHEEVPLQYIANYLGITRETISRIRKRTMKP